MEGKRPFRGDPMNCACCGEARVIVSEIPDYIRKELKEFVSENFIAGLKLKWYFCANCEEYTLLSNQGSSL